jgi:hypothetical protein
MAQLAIALAGAGAAKFAVGAGVLSASYFGASTVGIGWAVGSMVGSMMFGPQGQNQQGPRLSDLSVQGSAYGNFIPITYGSMRVAGNIVWATDIVERRTTKKVSGGKGGGGKAKVTTYSYFANFATMLCEGEISSVQRIWADGNLIYDTSASNESITGAKPTIRIYKGTEDQLPDPLIQSIMGAANTPAYRGRAYVVFESLALQEFGNRIPNLTFEVIRGTEFIPNVTYYDRDTNILPTVVNFSGYQAIDLDSRICWWVGTQTIDGNVFNRLNATNFDTGTLFYEQFFPREPTSIEPSWFREFNEYALGLGNTSSCVYVPFTSEVWIAGASLSDNHFVHDAFTGKEITRITKQAGSNGDFGFVNFDKFTNVVIFTNSTSGNNPRAIFYEPLSKQVLTSVVTLTSAPFGTSILAFSETDTGSLMWAGARNRLEPIVVRSMITPEIIGLFGFEDFLIVEGEIQNATPFRNMFYDEIRQVMVIINTDINFTSITIRTYSTDRFFTKLNEVTFSGIYDIGSAFHSQGTDQYILCHSTTAGTEINYINPNDLSLNFKYLGGPATTFNPVRENPIVDIERSYALGGIGTTGQPKRFARVPLGKRTQDEAVQLKDIVDDISNRAGLTQGEIDTSAMTDSVKGYVITKQAPARAAIEPLLTAYFYNPVESST